MLIGIISDSHDHVPNCKKVVEIFKERNIDLVLHAGDYCSPFSVLALDGLKLIGVFGNNDGDHYRIQQKFDEIGGELHNEFYSGNIDDISIAMYHGTQVAITEALVLCGKYDLVISGHTHQTHIENHNKTMHINPGSLNGFDQKASFATFDTQTQVSEIHYL